MAVGLLRRRFDPQLRRERLPLSEASRDPSSGRGSAAPSSFELPAAPIQLCAAALLLMMAAFVLVKTARDAVFFTGGGIEALPHAYLGIALLSLPLALATAGIMRLAGPRRARVLLPVLASAAFLALAGDANTPGSSRLTIFFMIVPLLFGLLFSTAWLLAGELLEGQLYESQLAAYQWIGAASILGGALGGGFARALSGLPPFAILASGCGCLLASAAVMAVTQMRYRAVSVAAERIEPEVVLAGPAAAPAEAEATAAARSAPVARLGGFLQRVAGVARQPYVRRLALIAMVGALTGVFVEFLFYLLASSSTRTMGGNARFFANAYLVMNASAFLLQVAAFRPLQRWIGVTGTLLTLPLVLFGGASALLAGVVMTVGAGLRIAEGGVKQSLHRSSWEQAFLPVKRSDRGLAKLVVDGAGARMAEGLAAGLLVLWIRFGLRGRAPGIEDARGIIVCVVAATLVWLLLALATRRETLRHAAAHPEDSCRPDSPLPDG